MSLDWFTVRAPPIDVCEHGVRENSNVFDTIFVGPRTWDRITYPSAMVLPESTTRSGGNDFEHRVDVVMYFERTRDYDYLEDVMHPVASVIRDTLEAARATEEIVSFIPAVVEDYAGEMDNTQVLLVRVQFEFMTLVDVQEAGKQ